MFLTMFLERKINITNTRLNIMETFQTEIRLVNWVKINWFIALTVGENLIFSLQLNSFILSPPMAPLK